MSNRIIVNRFSPKSNHLFLLVPHPVTQQHNQMKTYFSLCLTEKKILCCIVWSWNFGLVSTSSLSHPHKQQQKNNELEKFH